MKLKYYINESAISDIFYPYFKNIGDVLSKNSFALSKLDFEEFYLNRPTALNTVLKLIRMTTPINNEDFHTIICLLKHENGGVSIYFITDYNNKTGWTEKISEFGDTRGRISNVYVCKVDNWEQQKHRSLRTQRGYNKVTGIDSHGSYTHWSNMPNKKPISKYNLH